MAVWFSFGSKSTGGLARQIEKTAGGKVELDLGRTGRDTPFWVRVEYRIPERSANAPAEDSTFTLHTLIDVLSRRREDENKAKSVEAGPFRLGN